MSAVAAPARLAEPRSDGFIDSYVSELRKLSAQMATRLLLVVAVVAPFAFGAVLKAQSGTPSDALFGAWVHTSGFAISLVVLGFAGTWGFPIVAGVIAGDLFSSEDRYGTWKTILTRSCTREDVFAGKLLAAATSAMAIGVVLAISSLVAGVVLVGSQSLVGLGGALVPAGRLLVLVLVSWLYCLLPLLAYTSLAVLFSVATRNGILGVLGPLMVAMASQLLALVGRGVVVHLLLISSAFDGWHGLFVTKPFLGPLLLSGLVCLVWTAACLTASWRILARRDFVAGTASRRRSWVAPVRVVGATTAVVGALALCSNLGPTGVTAYRLSAAIGPAFNNVTLLQQGLIGRHAPASAKLDILPNCNRQGAAAIGPGDWTCTLYVYLPQLTSVPFQQTSVEYDVSVQSNGCFKAQSPPTFIGGPTMRTPGGKSVANPLFVVYGCFDVL